MSYSKKQLGCVLPHDVYFKFSFLKRVPIKPHGGQLLWLKICPGKKASAWKDAILKPRIADRKKMGPGTAVQPPGSAKNAVAINNKLYIL